MIKTKLCLAPLAENYKLQSVYSTIFFSWQLPQGKIYFKNIFVYMAGLNNEKVPLELETPFNCAKENPFVLKYIKSDFTVSS